MAHRSREIQNKLKINGCCVLIAYRSHCKLKTKMKVFSISFLLYYILFYFYSTLFYFLVFHLFFYFVLFF